MLVGIFVVISALFSVGVSAVSGAFGDLSWLWVLPLSLLGCFVLLVLLWFAMMVLMAKKVDLDQTQEKDDPIYRKVIDLTIGALLILLRIKIHTAGTEQLPASGRFLLVCNHLHDTDPVVLLRVFRKSKLAFISKRENDAKFIIGPFLRKILCQPINRENDREALKTILRCIQLIKKDEVSIGVFPEGYVSRDRLLHPFRGGVFKIAQKANVPIVVCTLRNTHHIYANMKKLKPTEVTLHLVGVIPAEELQGRTAVDIAAQAHEMMARDLGPDLVLQEPEAGENT